MRRGPAGKGRPSACLGNGFCLENRDEQAFTLPPPREMRLPSPPGIVCAFGPGQSGAASSPPPSLCRGRTRRWVGAFSFQQPSVMEYWDA